MRNVTKKVLVGGAVVLAGSAVGVSMASGAGDDGNDTPLTGSALISATAAALAHTGGGEVIETESGTTAPRTAWRSACPTGRWSRSTSTLRST